MFQQQCLIAQPCACANAPRVKHSTPKPAGPRTFDELHSALSNAITNDIIVLTQNITEPAGYNWVPVQIKDNVTIRGNYHSVGLPNDQARQLGAPLLGDGSSAISGLTVENLSVYVHMPDAPATYPAKPIGAFARAVVNSTFTNCAAYGLISQVGDKIGGLVGSATGTTAFTNCANSAAVTGKEYVGGIVGYAVGTPILKGCANSARIDGTNRTGGIAGLTTNANITNCSNSGSVSTSAARAAGIVSETDNCLVSGCLNSGEISGGGDIAGIVSVAVNGTPPQHTTIVSCKNTGNIYTKQTTVAVYFGGIVANLGDNNVVNRCINTGSINDPDVWQCDLCHIVGGIVGSAEGGSRVIDSINEGDVYSGADTSGSASVGGIVGVVPQHQNRVYITGNKNKGSVTGGGSNAGGIVGVSVNNVTISNNIVSGKNVKITGSANVGGIVGSVQKESADPVAAIVANNRIGDLSLITTAGGTTAHVHRIIGDYNPTDVNYWLLVETNYAEPKVVLTGDNTTLPVYDFNAKVSPPGIGITYNNAAVANNDPDLGANRLNGANRELPQPRTNSCIPVMDVCCRSTQAKANCQKLNINCICFNR
ncbi:MAG: hypothetical protein LBS72_00690 [Oscillospiraceae bacterium]|jgi:hypothetical protein|nr:hypothetical protein [Oscillospiraceae bacterium]